MAKILDGKRKNHGKKVIALLLLLKNRNVALRNQLEAPLSAAKVAVSQYLFGGIAKRSKVLEAAVC